MFIRIMLAIIAIVFFMSLIGKTNKTELEVSPDENQETKAISESSTIATTVNKWEISNTTDPMSGKSVKQYSVSSNNQTFLDFPYKGGTNAKLVVRNHPRYGNDVLIMIDKGQLLCNTIRCNVSIKIDDGKVITYKGSEPSDYDKTIIFMPNYKSIVQSLKKSKKTLVEIDFYKNGSFAFEFNTINFPIVD